jgi:hypothetical protein
MNIYLQTVPLADSICYLTDVDRDVLTSITRHFLTLRQLRAQLNNLVVPAPK